MHWHILPTASFVISSSVRMQAQLAQRSSWTMPSQRSLSGHHVSHKLSRRHDGSASSRVRAAAFPPGLRSPLEPLADQISDPVLKAAIKEPLAFWGGMFAGALGLNLNEEPLKAWIQRTSDAATEASSSRTSSNTSQ